MAQNFTVCRVGMDWAVRDVTGAIYGRSRDIQETIAAARRLAGRVGGKVVFSSEAEIQLRLRPSKPID